jgi:hypothetical protein
MTHPLSALGAGHTLISIVPVIFGIYSFARYGGIEAGTRSGRIYLTSILMSVLTSFGLSSTGGFNAGHALGILALLTLAVALTIPHVHRLGRARRYLSQLAYTFSFFLLLVPGINETLTRLPVARPLASGPDATIVRAVLAAWVVIFVLGALVQGCWIRVRRARTQLI